MNDNFSDRLKETLLARGLSAAQLAREIGVSNGYMSNLLSGNIAKPHKHLESLSDVLRVRAFWLLTGDGEPDSALSHGVLSIPLYGLCENHGTRHYLKNIDLSFLNLSNLNDSIYALKIIKTEVFDGEMIFLVNEAEKGSGVFLLQEGTKIIVSTRVDKINEVTWIHNSSRAIDMTNSIVLGKVVAMFENHL